MPGLAEHRFRQGRRASGSRAVAQPQPVFAVGDMVEVRDTADIREKAAKYQATLMVPGRVGIVERVFEAHLVIGGGGIWRQPSYRVVWEGPNGTTYTTTVPKARIKLAR